MGFGPAAIDFNFLPTEEEWDNTLWPEIQIQIKFLNAIGLFWIGTEEEKKIAKTYLKTVTSKDYKNPALYLEMWYHKHYNYSF